MSDLVTHREVVHPPVMDQAQLDRLFHAMCAGMGLAFLSGLAVGFWGGIWFHLC